MGVSPMPSPYARARRPCHGKLPQRASCAPCFGCSVDAGCDVPAFDPGAGGVPPGCAGGAALVGAPEACCTCELSDFRYAMIQSISRSFRLPRYDGITAWKPFTIRLFG